MASINQKIKKIDYAIYHEPNLLPILVQDCSISRGLLHSRLSRVIPRRVGIEFELVGTLYDRYCVDHPELENKGSKFMSKHFGVYDYCEDIGRYTSNTFFDQAILDVENVAAAQSRLSGLINRLATDASSITRSSFQSRTEEVAFAWDRYLESRSDMLRSRRMSRRNRRGTQININTNTQIQVSPYSTTNGSDTPVLGIVDDDPSVHPSPMDVALQDSIFNEIRVSIINGYQLKGLYKIMNLMKQYCEIPVGGGIHIHVDFSKYYCNENNQIAYKYITNRLDEVANIFPEYTGTYNKKRVGLSQKASWVNISNKQSIEFRIAPLTFNYETLLDWIIKVNKFVSKLISECHLKPKKYWGKKSTYSRESIIAPLPTSGNQSLPDEDVDPSGLLDYIRDSYPTGVNYFNCNSSPYYLTNDIVTVDRALSPDEYLIDGSYSPDHAVRLDQYLGD